MWGRIALGLRSLSSPAPEFLASWTRMIMKGLRTGDEVLDPVMRKPIVMASNQLVRQFTVGQCDTLLMLDDDMVFPPDTLETMRSGGGQYGIYGVLYASRRLPHNPVVFRSAHRVFNYTDDLGGDIDVEFCGMGFTLIRRTVIEKIKTGYMKDEAFSWGPLCEDGAICNAARKLGFKVGINSDISVGHMSADPVYWNAKTNAYEIRKFE